MKFLVTASFSGYTADDAHMWTNGWVVGIFDNIATCYDEVKADARQTMRDSIEGLFEDNALERKLTEMLDELEVFPRTADDFTAVGQNQLLATYDYIDEYCDGENIVDYVAIRIE